MVTQGLLKTKHDKCLFEIEIKKIFHFLLKEIKDALRALKGKRKPGFMLKACGTVNIFPGAGVGLSVKYKVSVRLTTQRMTLCRFRIGVCGFSFSLLCSSITSSWIST